jgi:hypothetical protein
MSRLPGLENELLWAKLLEDKINTNHNIGGLFSCSENKSITITFSRCMYKDAHEKTGKIYWFFTVADNNEIQIMYITKIFAKFKKDNKKLFQVGKRVC